MTDFTFFTFQNTIISISIAVDKQVSLQPAFPRTHNSCSAPADRCNAKASS